MKPYVPFETARSIAFDQFFWPFKHEFPGIKLAIAGSILRKKETVHDIDITINSDTPEVRKWVKKRIECKEPGQDHIKGILYNLPTDVWLTSDEEWAPMLLFATGPSEFNIFMRYIAKSKGMILNQRGLFLRTNDGEQGPRIDNNTEGNIIWLVLNQKWIPPERREAVGFEKKERVATVCAECNKPFIKNDALVRNDNQEWVHQIHTEKF